MTFVRRILKNEPAIRNQAIALVGLILAAVLDVIQLEGGASAAVIAAVLAAAGVTRQQVTPTSKL
jgi:hypothetical protein